MNITKGITAGLLAALLCSACSSNVEMAVSRTKNEAGNETAAAEKKVIYSVAEVLRYTKNELVNEADVIIRGTVISQEVEDDFEGFPATDTVFQVMTVFKGEPEGTVEVRVQGGVTDDTELILNEEASPQFSVGDEVTLFLSENKGTRPDAHDFGYYIVGQYQGVFKNEPGQDVMTNSSTITFQADESGLQAEIQAIDQENGENNLERKFLPAGQEANI